MLRSFVNSSRNHLKTHSPYKFELFRVNLSKPEEYTRRVYFFTKCNTRANIAVRSLINTWLDEFEKEKHVTLNSIIYTDISYDRQRCDESRFNEFTDPTIMHVIRNLDYDKDGVDGIEWNTYDNKSNRGREDIRKPFNATYDPHDANHLSHLIYKRFSDIHEWEDSGDTVIISYHKKHGLDSDMLSVYLDKAWDSF